MSKIMTPKVVVPSAFVAKAEIGDKVWTMIDNIPTEVAVASHVVAFSKLKKSSNEVVEKTDISLCILRRGQKHRNHNTLRR